MASILAMTSSVIMLMTPIVFMFSFSLSLIATFFSLYLYKKTEVYEEHRFKQRGRDEVTWSEMSSSRCVRVTSFITEINLVVERR